MAHFLHASTEDRWEDWTDPHEVTYRVVDYVESRCAETEEVDHPLDALLMVLISCLTDSYEALGLNDYLHALRTARCKMQHVSLPSCPAVPLSDPCDPMPLMTR